ncbi:MAG: VOC family protein [Mycobacterium sp.]
MRAEEGDETIEELVDEARQALSVLASVQPPKGHALVHLDVSGPDAVALRQFYSKAFGWTLIEAAPDYTMPRPGDGEPRDGSMQTSRDMPPYVSIYVHVDDLGAKLSEIQQLGGKVVVPSTPISEAMSLAMFADPGGAVVGLLEGAASAP